MRNSQSVFKPWQSLKHLSQKSRLWTMFFILNSSYTHSFWYCGCHFYWQIESLKQRIGGSKTIKWLLCELWFKKKKITDLPFVEHCVIGSKEHHFFGNWAAPIPKQERLIHIAVNKDAQAYIPVQNGQGIRKLIYEGRWDLAECFLKHLSMRLQNTPTLSMSLPGSSDRMFGSKSIDLILQRDCILDIAR